MRRRDALICALAVAVAPHAAAAQQTGKLYRAGFLSTAPGPRAADEAFTATLTDLGYREGGNFAINLRTARAVRRTIARSLQVRADEVIK